MRPTLRDACPTGYGCLNLFECCTPCAAPGTSGKTTTAWLIRGIFEEWGKLTGMAGSIENALYADKLDREGNLWAPQEPDPTIDRHSAHFAPYFTRALFCKRHLL